MAAAVRWVRAGLTQASTFRLTDQGSSSLPGAAAAGDGLFVYTYAEEGQLGRMESVQNLREPIVPFPLAWRGDTYYLDTANFTIAGTARPGVAIGIEDIRVASDSSEERWRRTASYSATLFAMLRLQDPLRLLEAFTPIGTQVAGEGNGVLTLEGKADTRAVVGSDLLRDMALKELDTASQARLLPDEVGLSLTLSTEDNRPIELRIREMPAGDGDVLVRWQRATQSPRVPEGYVPLLDYVRPAADPATLLTEAARWMEESPVRVDYPGGHGLLDLAGPAEGLFRIFDLPGNGGWGGAFPDEAEAGALIKRGEYFLWSEDSGRTWIAADQLELQKADAATFELPPEKRDPDKQVLVYRAVLRAYLLVVLDPYWWIGQMRDSVVSGDEDLRSVTAVSKTSNGYEITTTSSEGRVFPFIHGYTTLFVLFGNPPPSIAKKDTGDRPWNYTQELTLTLETDPAGRPLALTLTTNAPSGFAALQSVHMTFERTTQHVAAPEDGVSLLEVLEKH